MNIPITCFLNPAVAHYVTMPMHPQIRTEYLSAAQVALVDTLVSGSVYQHYFETCDLVYRPICLQAIEIKTNKNKRHQLKRDRCK